MYIYVCVCVFNEKALGCNPYTLLARHRPYFWKGLEGLNVFPRGKGMCGIWRQVAAIFPKEMYNGLSGVEVVAPEYIDLDAG
jgi:hypothetical protein